MKTTYQDLNAELNLWSKEGKIQLDKDKEAAKAFFLEHVNQNTVFFHTLEEKAKYLIDNGCWDAKVFNRYLFEDVKDLFRHAYSFKFRFSTYFGALKFYQQYALKTNDGSRFLERFEDRVVMNALAFSTDIDHAKEIVTLIMTGRFQPATPTFLNAGRSKGGMPVSCYLLRAEDNMESISKIITDSLQLSKRGGGVSILLTNLREFGAPIQNIENQSTGVIPIMKILEDSFSYANQLGQRQGAGAVYLHACHPDIMRFLDTKRENADEKTRIKTLSLGVVIPDVAFEAAKNNEDLFLFSPYDIERVYGKPMSDISITKMYDELKSNDEIKKTTVNARKLFQRIASIQFESGYPYIMFEDTVNKGAPDRGKNGWINMSNLCSEILQPNSATTFNEDGTIKEVGDDIACNLGSLNVAKMMECESHEEFHKSVGTAYHFLNQVAHRSNLQIAASVKKGNEAASIGLGQMNLHGWLIQQGIKYDSPEARDFFKAYMANVTSSIISFAANNRLHAPYDGFEDSGWKTKEFRDHVMQWFTDNLPDDSNVAKVTKDKSILLNAKEQIEALEKAFDEASIFMPNRNLQAIPPTGSISYINHSTSSIHPVTAAIETRKEGKTGRVYYPAYGLTEDNISEVETAFGVDQKAIIDMYSVAAPFVDQGMSLTLFFTSDSTTRDVNRIQNYAWRSKVKTLYYIRILQKALEGTEVESCVSCSL